MVMAYIVMAYIVMAFFLRCLPEHTADGEAPKERWARLRSAIAMAGRRPSAFAAGVVLDVGAKKKGNRLGGSRATPC